jgi:hypothetical protein
MLDDPNSLLRDQISKQKILTTTTIFISTNPALPLFGGGCVSPKRRTPAECMTWRKARFGLFR